MKRITGPIYRFLDALAIALCAVLVAVVFFGVVDRYALKTGSAWTEELARYVLIWLSLISAVVTAYHSRHFRITILVDLLPAGLRRAIFVLVNALSMVMLAGLLVWGASVTDTMSIQASAAMRLPMNWIYVSLPISCALMILVLLDETVDMIRFGALQSGQLASDRAQE